MQKTHEKDVVINVVPANAANVFGDCDVAVQHALVQRDPSWLLSTIGQAKRAGTGVQINIVTTKDTAKVDIWPLMEDADIMTVQHEDGTIKTVKNRYGRCG